MHTVIGFGRIVGDLENIPDTLEWFTRRFGELAREARVVDGYGVAGALHGHNLVIVAEYPDTVSSADLAALWTETYARGIEFTTATGVPLPKFATIIKQAMEVVGEALNA